MPIVNGLHHNEAYRIRGCQGCKWLGYVSNCGYCKFYLENEWRRPCKAGFDCIVKELDSDPDEVEAVVKKTVKRYEEIQRNKIEMRVKWDTAKAKQMWEDGVKAADVAKEMGTTRRAIVQYAHKHGWRKGYCD